MKNTLRLLSLSALCMFSLTLFASCDNDENKEPDQLPTAAQVFLSDYFGSDNIGKVTYDKKDKEWEVKLVNTYQGYEVTFDKEGNWMDVDAPALKTIPAGIAPMTIVNYIDANYNGYGINEIEKTKTRYEVELTDGVNYNGPELYFNLNGAFQSVDMN